MKEGFDYWEWFAHECERAKAPLYVQIVRGVGKDDALKEIASHVKRGQPMANILLAAVHFLLLRGAEHPLRRHYPNLNGGHPLAENAFPAFRDFVLSHRQEVGELIAKGVTNTNEVGRCSALHAGFRALAAETGEPLALIEVGPSAGLNLIWDRYRIRYSRGEESFAAGASDARLTIDCALHGEKLPPLGPSPRIASRVGLELNPVDLKQPFWRDWLRALVWPDNLARFARLESAIDIFQGESVEIRPGNALSLLPDAIAQIPEDRPVCIYHTYVIYQFSEEMRESLEHILIVAGLRRPVWRLSAEGTLDRAGEAPLLLGRYHDGIKDVRQLALTHHHGAWLEWQA